MGGLTPAEVLRRHATVGLDSNLFIYLIDDVAPWAGRVAELLVAVDSGLASAVLSAIGLTEILSGPARDGDLARLERNNDDIRAISGLSILPLTPEVAVDAAVIRGARAMTLPDAIHLACARAAGATAFITNDRRIRGSAKLEVVYLDELEPSGA
jgi:predicted nucleic acid-binding protein